jgi:hypothetical protein
MYPTTSIAQHADERQKSVAVRRDAAPVGDPWRLVAWIRLSAGSTRLPHMGVGTLPARRASAQ